MRPTNRSLLGVTSILLAVSASFGCDNASVPDLPEFEPIAVPNPDDVDAVVFLLGDGGATAEGRSPVLRALSEDVESWSRALGRDSAVSVIFPGDIVYPVGVRDRDHPEFPRDSVRLWNQIRLVAGPAALEHATLGVFLAGNHDWGNSTGDEGLDRVANLGEAIAAARETGPRVSLLPPAGSPGPVVRDLRQNVRIVLLDTHWFLQGPSSEAQDEFFDRLSDALTSAGDRHVIMVQHHPYRSAGPHGALLPGPQALGIPFLLKKTGTLVQDLDSPVYDEFQRRLRRAFRDTGKPPLVFAAGHDHSLQVLSPGGPFDPEHVLVSGAGSKLTPITQTAGMRYGASRPGYMFLVFRRDDAVDLFVVAGDPGRLACPTVPGITDVEECMEAGIDSLDVVFSLGLVDPSGEHPALPPEAPTSPWWDPLRLVTLRADSTSVESDSAADAVPEAGPPPAVTTRRLFAGVDSVTAGPGESYPAGAVHRFLFGDLNRHLWALRFRVPVLDLDSLGGGVTVEEVAGGRQTPGLRLRGADGVTYQFRSIVNEAGRLFPERPGLPGLVDVAQDQMAARFPLAAMVVARLEDAVDIHAARPVPVVLPDDERLGRFRETFAGRMGWIEVRPDELEGDRPGFAGASRITGSEELFEELYSDPRSYVDGPALLKARLLDMLVGDWDRHADQWRWAAFETGGGTRWEPIPRDRDWAFSRVDGVVPTVLGWFWRQYVGFAPEQPDIRRLTASAEVLERRLLSGMDRAEFLAAARELRDALPDSILADAVESLPPSYLEVEGRRLFEALRQRRNGLMDLAEAWYELRNHEVHLFGTEAREVFEISRDPSGSMTVRILSDVPGAPARFERTFLPDVTENVIIHGADGTDRIVETGPETEISVEFEEIDAP